MTAQSPNPSSADSSPEGSTDNLDIGQLFEQQFETSAGTPDTRADAPEGQTLDSPHAPPAVAAADDDRPRSRMLAKVGAYWIDGVLASSLQHTTFIKPNVQLRPDAVRPLPTAAPALPDGERTERAVEMIDLFDQLDRNILILGAPGAGKTTNLLMLLRGLLDRAATDPSQPMPVVFNLASWSERRQQLDDWLLEELSTKYQVNFNLARQWLANDQLILLLDGLDEMDQRYQEACVDAINHFQGEKPFTDVIVSSRLEDHDARRTKLALNGAVVLQPLTPRQIETYLADADGDTTALQHLWREDDGLRQLVRSPLMLNMALLAYRDTPIDAIPPANTPAERRRHLLETYVERQLKIHPNAAPYSDDDTVKWLTWVARIMESEGQKEFYIERLQPLWLSDEHQYRHFSTAFVLLVGGLVGVAFGVALTLSSGWGVGLLWGLVFGLAFALFFVQSVLQTGMRPIPAFSWSWSAARSEASVGLVIGLGIGLAVGLLAEVAFGLAVGLAGGLAFGLASGIGGGLAFGLAFGLAVGLTDKPIDMRITPNQGIRQSARNMVAFGVAGGVMTGMVFGLAAALAIGSLNALSVGLAFGVPVGLLIGLSKGGDAVLEHLLLRYVLSRNGDIPVNYAAFLNYAADLGLLIRVGGGYIFKNRHLLEYFLELGAQASQDQTGQMNMLLQMGAEFNAEGKYLQALGYFQQALTRARAANLPTHELELLSLIARSYTRLNQHESALAHTQEALALARQQRDEYAELIHLISMARHQHALYDYPAMIDALEAGLPVARALADTESESRVYAMLGRVYYTELSDYDRAAKSLRRYIGLNPRDGRMLLLLAGVYRHLGDDSQADATVEKARRYLDKHDLYNMACLESIAGNTDRALDLLRDALAATPALADFALTDPDLNFVRDDSRFAALVS